MATLLVGDECEIVIGRGLPSDPLLRGGPGRRVALLVQEGASSLEAGLVRRLMDEGHEVSTLRVVDGEAAKTISNLEAVYQFLAGINLPRDGVIIGLGGGALTDLAGFVAGTWLRGVRVVYVPTTLLGAVDAAIGGKTGINLAGKNLVGLFRHPERVLIDLAVLEQLPEDLIVDGLGEVAKAGFIADPGMVEMLARDGIGAPLETLVTRAVRVKVDVVAEDFRESDRRMILNYGHTIGHAIELSSGLSHGRAVAVGMMAAGHASERLLHFGRASEQRRILESLGLPVTAPQVDIARVRALLSLDKKHDFQGHRMVLLRDWGEPEIRRIDDALIDESLAAVGIR